MTSLTAAHARMYFAPELDSALTSTLSLGDAILESPLKNLNRKCITGLVEKPSDPSYYAIKIEITPEDDLRVFSMGVALHQETSFNSSTYSANHKPFNKENCGDLFVSSIEKGAIIWNHEKILVKPGNRSQLKKLVEDLASFSYVNRYRETYTYVYKDTHSFVQKLTQINELVEALSSLGIYNGELADPIQMEPSITFKKTFKEKLHSFWNRIKGRTEGNTHHDHALKLAKFYEKYLSYFQENGFDPSTSGIVSVRMHKYSDFYVRAFHDSSDLDD